jgi:hypothetical protein
MPQRRPFLLVLVALAMSHSLSGCACFRNFTGARPAAPPACVLAADASKEEVIGFLNENTQKITAWRTDKATISTRGKAGVPMRVGATIAVESPRNFRLIAHSVIGNEVDLGSNQEQFWFWNKHNDQPGVFLARHDEELGRKKRFPIPFQPDWIIEALGVIDIDPEDVTMQPGSPGSNTVWLLADRVSPQGFKIRKVTVVDTCRGVIREHALYDARGQLIARAALSGHNRDPKSDAILPSQIAIEWPQAQLAMTVTLAGIEVNPPRIPPAVWAVPHYTGYAIKEMSE